MIEEWKHFIFSVDNLVDNTRQSITFCCSLRRPLIYSQSLILMSPDVIIWCQLTSAPLCLTPRQQNILAVIPALAVTLALHRLSAPRVRDKAERSEAPASLPARLTEARSQVTTSPSISKTVSKSHWSNERSDIHRRGARGGIIQST